MDMSNNNKKRSIALVLYVNVSFIQSKPCGFSGAKCLFPSKEYMWIKTGVNIIFKKETQCNETF